MGWLIALGILVVIGFFPLGFAMQYNWEGLQANLLLGPVKFSLWPKRKPKKEKPAEEEKEVKPVKRKKTDTVAEKQKKGGSLEKFWPIVKAGLEFLNEFRKKLIVRKLELEVRLAGEDPCDLAVNYGKTCAAVNGLIPQLERFLRIRKRSIWVGCDFTADQTEVYSFLHVKISFGRLMGLTVWYGLKALWGYINNSRKGG